MAAALLRQLLQLLGGGYLLGARYGRGAERALLDDAGRHDPLRHRLLHGARGGAALLHQAVALLAHLLNHTERKKNDMGACCRAAGVPTGV